MMDVNEEEFDPIVKEVPVYLSKKVLSNLHVMQYPVRPQQITYDDGEILQAKIRPKCRQVEVQVGMKTKSYYYDQDKGKQIAINVDGIGRESKAPEDNYFKKDMMDKVTLTSSKNVSDCKRYAVGVVSEDGIHLNPITSFITMKPKCSYLDLADSRKQKENDEDKDSDQEDLYNNLRKVSVKFEKHETEYRKNAREKTYEFLQKKIRDEPWVKVEFNKFGSERSDYERRGLFCAYENEQVNSFHLNNLEYLNQLAPAQKEPDIYSNSESNKYNQIALLELPLQQHLNQVMLKVHIATFEEIQKVLNREDCDALSIVKALQKEAVLVQGCWVLKSEILYSIQAENANKKSNTCNAQEEIMQKARDYALYLFTKSRIINKQDIENKIKISGFKLLEILKKIALPTSTKCCWEFLLPTDHLFLNKNKDVAQRQQMIWQSRHEQFDNL